MLFPTSNYLFPKNLKYKSLLNSNPLYMTFHSDYYNSSLHMINCLILVDTYTVIRHLTSDIVLPFMIPMISNSSSR